VGSGGEPREEESAVEELEGRGGKKEAEVEVTEARRRTRMSGRRLMGPGVWGGG
jgi:hypothetical protein